MKILITGGAGCLGSNLVEHWLPTGHEIMVIDNFATGKREVVPEVKSLKVIEGSIANKDLVEDAFRVFKPEIVVNSAAAYQDPSAWNEDALTNVLGSIIVSKACERHKVNKLINFQTALCYGRPSEIPIPVDHKTLPFTSYGISKTAGEQYILLSDVPTISLRLANITGPRLAIGPIPTFYKRLRLNQSCFCTDSYRDFLDMEDFLRLMDVMIKPEAELGVFNVSTGQAHAIKEIFDQVVSHLELPEQDVPIVPVSDDDVATVVLDPSKTFAAFDWKPKYKFEEIIKRQLQWYDKYGVSEVYSHLKDTR